MQQVILILTLIFSSILISKAQQSENLKYGTVEVSISTTQNDLGLVYVAFFDKQNFKKQPSLAQTSTLKNGKSTVTFKNVPLGEEYAVICFLDENDNKKLDFSESGVPIEKYGVSNTTTKYSEPKFDDAKFMLQKEYLSLEIKF